LYKIIAKILSKRLQKVMNKLIDEKKNAIIQGRGILDSIVVANEVLDDVRRRKEKCFIVKADFEKAYDSLSWEFLGYMFQGMGFYAK